MEKYISAQNINYTFIGRHSHSPVYNFWVADLLIKTIDANALS